MSTIYGSSVPATNGLAAPDQEGGLSISNPVMAPTAVVTSSAAEGAISQTIDSVAYNKEADQGNDTLLEPTTMAATDGIIGVAAEGVERELLAMLELWLVALIFHLSVNLQQQ